MKKRYLFILVLLCIASLAVTIYTIAGYNSYREKIIKDAAERLEKLSKDAALSINRILADAKQAADRIAEEYSSGKLDKAGIARELEKELKANPYFFSGKITYRPYAHNLDRRFYYTAYDKEKGAFVTLEDDYTGQGWYREAMVKGEHWSEPYYDGKRRHMTSYSRAFHKTVRKTGGRMRLGVVTIDITLAKIKEIIESIDLGAGGFGGLLSHKGTYLYHPKRSYVSSGKTILDIAREKNDADRFLLSERITRLESGILDHISTTTGKKSWLVYEPVALTGWSVQNTFLLGDIVIDRDILRKQLIHITASGLVFLIIFVFTVVIFLPLGGKKAWLIAIATAALLVVAIAVVWQVAMAYQSQGELPHNHPGIDKKQQKRNTHPIYNRAMLMEVTGKLEDSLKERTGNAITYIPTGVFIETLSFSGGSSLTATGFVWQKYPLSVPEEELPRQFTISGAESFKADRLFTDKTGDTELVRWRFLAEWQPHLAYNMYPLELEKVGFRLLHGSNRENVVLIPDLAGYEVMNPTSMPGLDKGLNLSGWTLKKSFFELREEDFKTALGNESEGSGGRHRLYFNVVIRKNFLDSFISNMAPLILVSFLLFCVLILTKSDADLSKKLEAGAGKVLAFCAGLFFVVVFSHIDIREKIAAGEIFYLEYFYLIMYVNLLFVSLNSILFHLKKVSFIQYKENMIPKLIYWPTLMGEVAIVTFLTFY
jgi:hypothetical protein